MTSPFGKPQRFYFLDSLRSILMLLGVLLHAAHIYSIHVPWNVHDPHGSIVFDILVRSIGVFRMPAFFVIAGLFAVLTIDKYGTRKFFGLRLKRLALPLVSTALLCNTLQAYLSYAHRAGTAADWRQFATSELPQFWTSGNWVQHLWFLNVLLIYCAACPLLLAVLRKVVLCERSSVQRVVGWIRQECRFVYLLAALALVWAFVERLSPEFVDRTHLFGLISISELMEYLPFFCCGMWLELDPELLKDYCTLQLRQWNMLLFAISLVLLCRVSQHDPGPRILTVFAHGLLNWTACRVCFGVFYRFLNRPTRMFNYLADASYTVYLLHHVVVVAFGCALLAAPLSAFTKFGLVTTFTVAITLAVHELVIRRVRLLRLLWNGQ